MISQVSIDAEKGIASIPLAGWSPILRQRLSGYFHLEGETLVLDFSHLSLEFDRHSWRSERQVFLDRTQEAATQGELGLFVSLLVDSASLLATSSSTLDLEGLRNAGETLRAELFSTSDIGLRDLMIEEITPTANWAPWVFHGQGRAAFLAESDIVGALIARIASEDDYRRVFGLLDPKLSDNTWAFETFIAGRWRETQRLIAEDVHKTWLNEGESVERIASILKHSPKAQGSRWVCEQIVAKADNLQLAGFIAQCRKIEAGDVQTLFERLRVNEPKGRHSPALGVAEALLALQRGKRGPLPVDLVLAALWHELEFSEPLRADAKHRAVIDRLCELPGGSSREMWEQLSPQGRNFWRRDLFDTVAGDPKLSEGVIHFACRWLDQSQFVEIEPVLLKLIDDANVLASVQALMSQPPRQLSLRAKTLVGAKLDLPSIEGSTGPGMEHLPSVGARTWLGDPSVEQVIYRKVRAVEEAFSVEYPKKWGADEEVLTATFLADVTTAMKEAVDQLRELSRATRGRFPSLQVNVRQPGKVEEGTDTFAGVPLATDVLFLTRVLDRDQTPIERATLVQVKKRSASEATGHWGTTVEVDLEQCQHLLDQTEHAFYLVLTPPAPDAKLWVAPARLIGNLAEMHESRSSISAVQARDASVSFADFFLTHLVGLWSGDERSEVIAIAKGDVLRGRTPSLIVEVIVRRQID